MRASPLAAAVFGSEPRSRISRRGLFAAAASVLAAPEGALAQETGETGPVAIRAGRWVEATEVGVARAQAIDDAPPEPIAFATPFPFTAVAPHWSGKEPKGATVELGLSVDGVEWSQPIVVGEDPDAGRPGRDRRRYGRPVTTAPMSWVRYRTFDGDGNPAALRGLAWEYIDAADQDEAGAPPAATPTPAEADGLAVISRAGWKADEALRFANGWEIWPPEYAPVTHAVVHHSDTANEEDPLAAIRSIYYYHAVTRGWGDIGYNFLVDFRGNVYEGRSGGPGVAGGHALGYNAGTCGICMMGRFADKAPPPEMERGLAAILARATAGLDPLGAAPLADIPNLPTICAHRDVNPTACPGDALYADLAPVRLAAVALREGALAAAQPARFRAGDAAATTAEGVTLRGEPALDAAAITTLALGEPLLVAAGPAAGDGLVWYRVEGRTLSGWVAADFLDPPASAGEPGAAVGGLDPGVATATQAIDWPVGTVVEIAGGDLNLRDGPGGAVVQTLPEGAWLEISGGPVGLDGTLWQPIDTGLGIEGWVDRAYLRPA